MTAAFGLFCNPESRRVEGFSTATGRILRERPALAPWQILLSGHAWQQFLDPRPRFLRLESPGRNWQVEKSLLLAGWTVEDEEAGRRWRQLPPEAVAPLSHEPGRIEPMRQWFLGWRRTLLTLSDWAKARGLSARWLCPPEDVICMFDKAACQERLENAGIAVPPALGIPSCFDELWEMMRAAGRNRIFLKPCHGSSASGVVALETGRNQLQAFSSTELVKHAQDGTQLYNRRRIQTWRGATDVRNLVDTICRERCLAQVWIPKAGLRGKPFDVRVVVIGGKARHVMVRLGNGPITNSQLLGGKAEPEILERRLGEEAWTEMLRLCERALSQAFPDSLYAGCDVLIEPDFKTAHILEINAFGDLLPRVLHEGRETYEWEVIEALRRPDKTPAAQPVQVSSMGA